MPDMLVQLLKLPPVEPLITTLRAQGVVIRRAHSFEMTAVREFIQKHFSVGWADEVTPCYSRQPSSLYIAIREGKVIGFGAYEATARAFFGPTGVMEAERGKDIGKALLLACLWGLREMGYVYGIIGGAGPTGFYEKVAGATAIPDSVPGIYADMLKG
ncbi:MAG TPA: GNAT family N-acetyltransferase [Chthonomonadaceae bacterium]|nr:GNAT family N-acetyltransferase [Chthonomonadaceae bacterium]